MKTICILLVFISLITSCNFNSDINGTWMINNDYYKATYRIYDEDNCKKALIVSYNDGTTKFSSKTKPNQYVFSNLKEQNGVYIDAISGATKTTAPTHTNHIKIKHKDTLEVTSYIMNKPLIEFWIKSTINN